MNSTATAPSVINFGRESFSGTGTLAETKTITVGATGFSAGTLTLNNFNQLGATAQSLAFTGTAALTISASSTFNGDVNFTAPQLSLNGGTYNGAATLEKTGETNNTSKGGNIFNAATIIKYSDKINYIFTADILEGMIEVLL